LKFLENWLPVELKANSLHISKRASHTYADNGHRYYCAGGTAPEVGAGTRSREETSFIASQLAKMYRQVVRILERDVGTDSTTIRLAMLRILTNQLDRRKTSAAKAPTTRAIAGPKTHW
jgi:hypothetical protein